MTIDEVLQSEPGRSRSELLQELLDRKIVWGLKVRILYLLLWLLDALVGERKMLENALRLLYSGHNQFLTPTLREYEEACQSADLVRAFRIEVEIANYRRRLFALSLLLPPSGRGEQLCPTLMREFDRQYKAALDRLDLGG